MSSWNAMRGADLPFCEAIGEAMHVAHPEDAGRMAEKLRLFPEGCFVLRAGGQIGGYAISHPWRSREALALNASLRALPDGPDTLYLHDLALLPEARGRGDAARLVRLVVDVAASRGLPRLSLVAVAGTGGFWARMGFRVVEVPGLAPVLRTYDAQAAYMVRDVPAP